MVTRIAFIVVLAFPIGAGAIPSLNVTPDGILTGADDVDIGGTLFDIEFIDGRCVDLFDGCDEASDFDFPSQAVAEQAGQALLDQVFLDGPLGDFDSVPEITLGCYFFDSCAILSPFSVSDVVATMIRVFNDDADVTETDRVETQNLNIFTNTTDFPEFVFFRVKRPEPTAAPEPGTLSVLVAGLAGLAVMRRRRSSAGRATAIAAGNASNQGLTTST